MSIIFMINGLPPDRSLERLNSLVAGYLAGIFCKSAAISALPRFNSRSISSALHANSQFSRPAGAENFFAPRRESFRRGRQVSIGGRESPCADAFHGIDLPGEAA